MSDFPRMTVNELTEQEQIYTYPQPTDISHIVGSVGRLRLDFDMTGTSFFTSWDDHFVELKTKEFQTEFGGVIDRLRKDPTFGQLLKDQSSLAKYCATHGSCQVEPNTYGLRVDTAQYSYLCRLDPRLGTYNGYIHCYQKEWLNCHLKESAKPIVLPSSKDNRRYKMATIQYWKSPLWMEPRPDKPVATWTNTTWS